MARTTTARRRPRRLAAPGQRHWLLVAGCLALAALPVEWRRRARGKLLDLRQRIGRGLQVEGLGPAPQVRADSNAVRLLQAELARLRRVALQAGIAKDVSDVDTRDMRLIPARATPLEGPTDVLCSVALDRGRQDGVEVGQPVLAGAALVGVVAQVGELSCEVRLITDPAFELRATILRDGGDVEGLLTGDGQGQLRFRPAVLDPSAPLPLPRLQESVVCSRQSSLCGVPALLGSVEAIERLPGEPRAHARILPAVDLQRLDGVVVLKRTSG